MLAYRSSSADHFAPQPSSSRAPAPTSVSTQPPRPTYTNSVRPATYDNQPSVASTYSAAPPIRTVRDPAPPAPPSAAPAGGAAGGTGTTAGKTDKGKLTEQWGPPPDLVKRDDVYLERGKLLGEGGFARVYLATEPDGRTKALKVVAKEQLKSTKNKSKLFAEIKIHQAMVHPNIISFEHCFEDTRNVYMQLELCANGSMLDLMRRRRRYTEPEARFYMVQLIGACEYMHDNSVIHRDLKLGNLMLDADMNLRVGDFGLAALVKFPGERKKTICGTPNYIAPEILFDTTTGHSFEADVWSIGVILYTLLIGKPPFQQKEVKNIYRKIKSVDYEVPATVEISVEAEDLIKSILAREPEQRPTLSQILQHNFFVSGPFPLAIPPSANNLIPDFRHLSIRRSHANFHETKARCGIVEPEVPLDPAPRLARAPSAASLKPSKSQPLAPLAEEDELEAQPAAAAPPPRRRSGESAPPVAGGVVARPATEREARGMEREVQQVLQPGSPIADLLKSARKPLMVSPQAEPKELLQRKMVAEARQQSSSGLAEQPNGTRQAAPPLRSSSHLSKNNENAAPVPFPTSAHATTTRPNENAPPASPKSPSRHKRSMVPPSVVAALSPSRQANGAGAGAAERREQPAPPSLAPFKLAPEPVTTRHPSGELYDATWRTLDRALNVSSSAALRALPNPQPLQSPEVFITSWVDYTHKYGTAYSLTDGSSGLYFNDSTTMILAPDKKHFDYMSNRVGNVFTRTHHSIDNRPAELERKAHLLQFFDDYMGKALTRNLDPDPDGSPAAPARTQNMDFLVKYYRMKAAIVFKMSNDVLQFNFYDHTKVILTARGAVVTFLDAHFRPTTYSLGQLFAEALRAGYWSREEVEPRKAARLEEVRFILSKLEYARDVLRTLSARKAGEKGREVDV